MGKKKDEFRDMDKERMLKATFAINDALRKFYDFKDADPSDYSEILMLLAKMVHIIAAQSVFACGADELPDETVADIIYKVIQTTGDVIKDIQQETLMKCIQNIKMRMFFGGFDFGFGSQDLN